MLFCHFFKERQHLTLLIYFPGLSVLSQRKLLLKEAIIFEMLTPSTGFLPGRVAQSVGHLTRKSGVLVSILDLATYFRFSFRFFKQGICQLLAKVCARSTG